MTHRIRKGQFLLSDPHLRDENFIRSVIVIVDHSPKGTIGFVVNQPMNLRVSEAVNGANHISNQLYKGGPCDTNKLHCMHAFGDQLPGGLEIVPGWRWGGHFNQIFEGLRQGFLPTDKVWFFAGYAGWEPGQLEDELKMKSWLVASPDMAALFKLSTSVMWQELIRSLGPEYAHLAHAPLNPDWN